MQSSGSSEAASTLLNGMCDSVNGHFQARAPYLRLIAATDGSELGGMALVGAAQLARRTKAELYVFHAAGDMEGEAAVRRQVRELLEGVPCKVEIRNLIAGTPMSPTPGRVFWTDGRS